MHKTLEKVKNKRLADLIENIIKKMNKNQIKKLVQSEYLNLDQQFQNPELIGDLNDDLLRLMYMPVLGGKDKSEIIGSKIKVGGAYKGLQHTIKKNMKLVKKLDKKSLDALFFIHVYDLAGIALADRNFRKILKIKKGLFG
jgi:hypothetical protein